MAQLNVAEKSDDVHVHDEHGRQFWALTLGAVGVVYGDIGTSPLYAFREAVAGRTRPWHVDRRSRVRGPVADRLGADPHRHAQYVHLLLRADNKGEGGTLSPHGARAVGRQAHPRRDARCSADRGAALFSGDAIITPAISVLSAVEGLKLVAPQFERYVLPLPCHPGAAVRRAVARHGEGGAVLRAHHGSGSLPWPSAGSSTSPTIRACSRPSIRSTASAFC